MKVKEMTKFDLLFLVYLDATITFESPLKKVKSDFYFTLKALFFLKIFQFLVM